MATGTIKWFNDQKGYGFIQQEGVTEDIFVHHTAIKMDGFRTLTPGEAVDFEIKKDDKGLKAVNVTRATGDGAAAVDEANGNVAATAAGTEAEAGTETVS